jgi:hypothetical protein
MSLNALIDIASSNSYQFTGVSTDDVVVYTTSETQNIHIGSKNNANPSMFMSTSNISFTLQPATSNNSISFYTNNGATRAMSILGTGYIGVNKQYPQYQLDIAGTVNATAVYVGGAALSANTGGGFVAGATNSTTTACNVNMSGTLRVSQNAQNQVTIESDGANDTSIICRQYGAGAGTDVPVAKIMFDGYTYTDQGSCDIRFFTMCNSTTAGNLTERMVVSKSGNIGIGNSTPSYKLDVSGIVNASALYVGGSPYIGSQWTTTSSNIYYTTGNVGIGTNAPSKTLHVAGDMQIDNTLYINNSIAMGGLHITKNNAGGQGNIVTGITQVPGYTYNSNVTLTSLNSSFDVITKIGATEIMRCYGTNNNVGIGTATPTSKLHVVGTINATTDLQVNGTSISTTYAPKAGPTFTGTLTAATVAATTITGAGSGITALSGTNIASGTVPVLYGGTGVGTSTGTGSVVLSAGPTLTGTVSAAAINTTGWVGMGTASPIGPVHVVPTGVFAGTVATTISTPTVAGTGTAFLSTLVAGDNITISAVSYTVLSIANNTTLTLTGNASATVSGVAYSTTTVKNSLTMLRNGYVGIGTNAPTTGLHVIGGLTADNMNIAGTLTVVNVTDTTIYSSNVTASNITSVGIISEQGASLVSKYALSNHDAAAITAGTLPVLRGGTGVTTSTGTGNNVLSAGPTFTGTVSAAALNTTGNVGIGTSGPIAGLQVSKNINIPFSVNNSGTGGTTAFDGTDANLNNLGLVLHSAAVGGIGVISTICSAYTSPGNYASQLRFATADSPNSHITRMTISSSGSVGIGTITPTTALHVVGTVNATTDLQVNGTSISTTYAPKASPTFTGTVNTAALTITGTTTANGPIVVQNNTDGTSAKGIYLWNAGDTNWGIYMGQSGAGKSLANGTATGGAGFAGTAFRLRITNSSTQGFIFENQAETALMSIRGSDGLGYFSGSVGIGTTSPSTALHVNGVVTSQSLNLTGTSVAVLHIISALDSTVTNGQSRVFGLGKSGTGNNRAEITYNHVSDGNAANNLSLGLYGTPGTLCVTAGGAVGIGTTSPSTALHVNGVVTCNSINGTTNNHMYMNITSGYTYYWQNGGSYQMSLSPSGALTTISDLTGFGSISDIKFKENIESLTNNLDIISKLRPVEFTWKNNIQNVSYRGLHDYGLIAQELEEVIPEAVKEAEMNGETYKTVKHERIIPFLVGSIQELQRENEILREQNNSLNERLTRLESLFNA